MKTNAARSSLVLPLLIAACSSPPAKPPGDTHLTQTTAAAAESGAIPPTVAQTPTPPRPKPGSKTETYSVVVNNVRVHDLLFALARDARVNVDIHPGLQGVVTLNAVEQTLPQILSRLARQLDLRWELDGQNLAVMPDTPYLRNYRIDYVNMNRDTSGSVAVSTQITSTIPGAAGGAAGSANNSTTKIDNTAKNRFWETLVQNVKDILRETDKILPEGSSDTVVEQESSAQAAVALPAAGAGGSGSQAGRATASALVPQQSAGTTTIKRTTFREAASVIAHPESGTIAVRASSRQHEKIQEFLDQVMASAKRQVLIEATIAEVELSQTYEQGINWGQLSTDPTRSGIVGAGIAGIGRAQVVIGRNSAGVSDMAIRLLETFGTVKVLSSPKISVLNNQPAVLKVVDNNVYFTVKVETNQNANNTTTNVTTTPFSVPIGFVMNVTPQVSENDTVLLNMRPSISRAIGEGARDPNPELIKLGIDNRIPVIRTRELESVLRVEDGQTAVLGGLMEDSLVKEDSAVPWFHNIPLIGALFAQKSSAARKTELVIFLRPTIVRESGLGGDFARLRQHLPSKDFFGSNKETRYQLLPSDTGDDKK